MMITGCEIFVDRSGVGHAWEVLEAEDLPAAIREEIEGEIEASPEGRMIGSNGRHYKWRPA